MRPSDYGKINDDYDVFSASVQIGIYGYFSNSRIEVLTKLKSFLISRKLNAKMSIDFENLQLPVISQQGDALRSSEMLFDSSRIHLFVLLPPTTDQSGRLLDSVSMEYGWVWKFRQPYVGVYIQRGSEISTLAQGAIDDMHDFWANETFDNIEDIFLNISKYCEAKIYEIFWLTEIK